VLAVPGAGGTSHQERLHLRLNIRQPHLMPGVVRVDSVRVEIRGVQGHQRAPLRLMMIQLSVRQEEAP
jgi:hypothetical protein